MEPNHFSSMISSIKKMRDKMITKISYDRLRQIVANMDDMDVEEAATLLILIERSRIMDAVKIAKEKLREASHGERKEFGSTWYQATGNVRIFEPQEKILDEEALREKCPEIYNSALEKKISKIKLALSDIDPFYANIFYKIVPCKAKVTVNVEE